MVFTELWCLYFSFIISIPSRSKSFNLPIVTAPNPNPKIFLNGIQNLDIDFSKFSFDETIQLNRFIDLK